MEMKMSYKYIYVLPLTISLLVTTSIHAQDLEHYKGESNRELKTVGSNTVQSVHELRQTLYLKPNETKKMVMQAKDKFNYHRWFCYDKSKTLNASTSSSNAGLVFGSGQMGTTLNNNDGYYLTGTPYDFQQYTHKDANDTMTVACDVSRYSDFKLNGTTFREPTLS